MRVLIADDAAVLRAAFVRSAIAAGHEIVGEAVAADEVLELVHSARPDIVVVDGRLPPDGATPLIARVHAASPEVRILVIAALDEVRLVRAARAAGAAGALLRPILPSHVSEALKAWP